MPLGANKAAIMGVAGVSTGAVVLISSQTADGDSALSFTSGITSTYGEYIFKFYNINPVADGGNFTFQGSTDGGSNYNATWTATAFSAKHTEADATALAYLTTTDGAQQTGFKSLTQSGEAGGGADESSAGEIHIFNPASTTYVKHFYARNIHYGYSPGAFDYFTAGYWNTTSAIDAIQFKISSGNFDGTIKLWGVK